MDEWQGLNGKCIVHRKSDLWHTYIFCEYAGMIFLCLKRSVYIIAQSSSSQQSSETRTIHESRIEDILKEADDTTLMAESEELKSLLMTVNKEKKLA